MTKIFERIAFVSVILGMFYCQACARVVKEEPNIMVPMIYQEKILKHYVYDNGEMEICCIWVDADCYTVRCVSDERPFWYDKESLCRNDEGTDV